MSLTGRIEQRIRNIHASNPSYISTHAQTLGALLDRGLIRKIAEEVAQETENDLCTAPGASDLTFGSLLDQMISNTFLRVDGRAGPGARLYTECTICKGNDLDRPAGRSSYEQVRHDANCILAQHLPRLRAMARKGVT